MDKHYTLDPVIIRLSPIGGNIFFGAVKSFDASITTSGNFVLNAKNSNVSVASQDPRVGW